MPDRSDDLLRDSREHMRLLIDGSDCTLYMLDPAGNLIAWNGDKREGARQHISRFYTPEDIASGKPADELQSAEREGRFETVGARVGADGSVFEARVVITAIRDEHGLLLGFGNVTRAVRGSLLQGEQVRRGEQELSDSVERLRAVVDTAMDGIMLIDAAGLVQMINPACERLFGYARDEALGVKIETLIPAWLGRSNQPVGDTTDLVKRGEVAGVRKDGIDLVLEVSIGETQLEGKSTFVATIHDIGQRKRTDAQLVQAQKMEAVGQLSGGIAHDFNNLLTVVIGNGDLLSTALKAQPELQRLAEMIITAGERGADLTQRLLAFSRRQTLLPVAMDCNFQVERMYQLLRRTLRPDITIELRLDPILHAVYADPAQLESAILNLALNAQDAMPGGGCISIATSNAALDERYRENHQDLKPGNYVLVSVTDNGGGMTQEVCDQVFEPFFTTKDIGKGSGLGLSMVYGFAKQSNGHVSLASEVGHGTVARLYLPSQSSPPGDAARVWPMARRTQEGGTETVLLVEDDASVRNAATASLEKLGYHVVSASNPSEALALLAQGAPPDLLFTDIMMPGGVDGWELAERARRIWPDLKVLFTSGYTLDALGARSRLSVDTVFLGKPYRNADLAERLREVLDAA